MIWLKHWLTESDNTTFDPTKAMGIYAFLHYHLVSGWQFFHDHVAFDPTGYGTGIGALFATLGVLFGLKKETPKDGQ
jgi:hypothetical protein